MASHSISPRPFSSKIKSPVQLKQILTRLKKQNAHPIPVFTNGCFDLLHKGHVTYLYKARKLGTHLIVAINSDSSVRLLKGPNRPINPLAARAAVIAALECVDFVTWFSEETPQKLIRQLRPQILTKGGDYRPEQIAGAVDVLSWGGKVRILPFVEGHSTTRIIKRTKK